MILNRLNVSNKFINYNNISIDLSKTGIYRISGLNGTGKTSIIEKIVFGNYDVIFQNETYYDIWKKDRFNLFTYIPQKIYEYSLTVGEYICKGNKQISIDKCKQMLTDFDLNIDILKTKFNVLSGGEKKKIQIITGLLKDTPYIFIDEPSNNLDNSSIECLNKILNKLSEDRIIILVTHDERFCLNIIKEITIDGNNISINEYNIEKNNNIKNPSKWRKNLLLTILNTTKNIPLVITCIFLIFIITILIFYSCNYFSNNLFINDYFDEETILVRANIQYDSDLNDDYIDAEKLIIDKETPGKNIKWLDIYNDVSKIKGLKDVYILNEVYYDEIYSKIREKTLSDKKYFISCPKEYYEILYYYSRCICDINMVDGSIPKDYQKEVSLSKNMLIKYYGYNETNVDNALGQQIYIEEYNDYYTIVGFTYYDYINISYEKEHNNLIYHYDENTYEDFVLEQYNYLVKADAYYDRPDEIVIKVDNKVNKEITNYIFENYPCVEIISSSFDEISCSFANKQTFIIYLIINIIISLIFSIALFFMNKSTTKYNLNIIEDYGIYYVNKTLMLILYKIFVISYYLLVVGLLMLLNTMINEYTYYTNIYILGDSLVLLLPIIIFLLFYKGNKKR